LFAMCKDIVFEWTLEMTFKQPGQNH